MSKQLAELLVKDKIITQMQFQDAIVNAGIGKSPISYLIDKKQIAENKLLYYLSNKFGLPSVNLAKFEVAPEILKSVSPDLARKLHFIPIQMNKGTMVIAVCDPTVVINTEELKFRLKMNVEAVLTSFTVFDAAMSKYYGGAALAGAAIESFKKDAKDLNKGAMHMDLVQVHDIESDQKTAVDAPVITLVNGILSEAMRRGASDIHVEPYEKRMRVRMRIDGVLYEIVEIPNEMKRAIVARFKIMSRMDISETRVPQDGRIKLVASGKNMDFRVNTLPTIFGEKVVLRLLSQGNLQLDLMKLGFEKNQMDVFKKAIYATNGMVLVTGPTGSGKTTTLYSALSELNQITDNISTAEDPVEYNLEGVNQVQVNKEVGLTFASVLRSLLRQDPDTILVGEIRDFETAEVSIQAALTGHLVLSTLHTNDAASTITRLVNMGVEPFLVVASLNAAVAQRLLRTICAKCKTEMNIPTERLTEFQIPPGSKFYKGAGCEACNKTGYKGRVAIYEVLDFTTSLKEMLLRGETMIQIKKQAIKDGMKTLRASAITKAIEGRTTLEEALASTMED